MSEIKKLLIRIDDKTIEELIKLETSDHGTYFDLGYRQSPLADKIRGIEAAFSNELVESDDYHYDIHYNLHDHEYTIHYDADSALLTVDDDHQTSCALLYTCINGMDIQIMTI